MSTRVRVRTSATLAGAIIAGSLFIAAPAHADGTRTPPPPSASQAPGKVDPAMMSSEVVDTSVPASWVFAGVGAGLMVIGAVMAGVRKRAAADEARAADAAVPAPRTAPDTTVGTRAARTPVTVAD